MHAAALALILVAGQSIDFYQDEPPQADTKLQDVRFGMGAASIATLPGVGAAFEVGLELKPWGPMALRTTLGSNLKVGWGTFFVAPEAVLRLNPVTSRWSPYLAVGASLGLVNITNQALGIDPIPTYRPQQSPAVSDGTGAAPPEDPNGDATGTPVELTYGPQASLGLRFQAWGRTALDVGARYTLLRFDGSTYNNFAIVLTVCAPGT